ncbi:MAG TPA: hypothetical protein VGK67_39920 [Myxococcales bacterium]|jgi:hypothetical protein
MTLRTSALVALAGLLLAGCPSKNAKPDFQTDVQPTPRAAVAFASAAACALDSDCKAGSFCFQGGCARQCAQPTDCTAAGASCSERGRCVAGGNGGGAGGGAGDIDVEPGTALTELPARVQQVAAGTDKLQLHVKAAPAIASGLLSYRVERTDGQGDAQQVRQASGSTDFDLEIETGLANPSASEPKDVEVYVITSAGAFRLSLIPQLPLSGYYAGQARLAQFGQTGVPLDFYVVTNPSDASLSQATEAFVLLPVGPEKIFSPHPKTAAASSAETMTRKLSWEGAPVNRWVAVFVSEFDLGDGSVVAAAGIAGQVRRTIRLEIEPFGTNEIIGKISDRWTGLYDARPDLGPRQPANVVFEGQIEMRRMGPAPLYTEINPPETVPEGDPKLLPIPAVGDCTDALLAAVPAVTLGTATYGCDTTKTVTAFKAATAAEQASCAIALTRESLNGDTTARQIASFLDNTNTSGESFADFMKRCAAGENGTCRPSAAVLCGRELSAYAYAGQEQDLASSADLVAAFQDASREAFLGRQLGAFQTDAQTRLDWLKTTDYPAIVTSAVKDLIDRLLREWAANVLDVHLGVLGGQFDDAGLAVLSRAASGADAVAARKALLLEMSQSWRGAADALTLAAARWNQLYQDDPTRKAKAAFVSGRMFDLYLVAGLLTNFNRDSGASFASGTFAAGFAQLMRDLGQLMQPFDKLVYARDAEVVVSTSVDPSSDNTTLLKERRDAAKAEIAAAASAVGQILAQAQSEALSQAELTNRMNNEINDVRGEMVELCGLPVGCTASTAWSDPTCLVRTGAGRCGFLVDHETGEVKDFDAGAQSVSEAGSRLLAFRSAVLAYNRAQEELRAHVASAGLYYQATEAFALQVLAANTTRKDMLDQLDAAIQKRQADRNTSLGKLLENLDARNQARRDNISGTEADMLKWNDITVAGINTTFGQLQSATALQMSAEGLYHGADLSEKWGAAIAEGFPKEVGLSNDTFSVPRMVAVMTGLGISTGMQVAGLAMEGAAEMQKVNAEKQQALTEAQVEAMRDASDLGDAVTEADVAELEGEAESAAQADANAEAALKELLTMTEKMAEAELAYQRDLGELNDRRTQLKQMLLQSAGLDLQVAQGELGMMIALQEYLKVAQRSELRMARLEDLQRQRAEINSIVGSPTAVFAWANRLEQAERRLQAAKNKLYDWLVALEYLAVRPFMDQRVQILLARNTYQLEAIAAEVERLQGKCGGPISRQTSELSLRDDLLGLTLSMVDPVTKKTLTPDLRLRQLLQRGYVPIDKRVRYTSDSTIGGLLSNRSVLAASFNVTLSDFANLAAACNAKAYSISVQLVGKDLGSGQPTVSILYDGSSELRSCQPGLEEYLNTTGRESTSFGAVTRLHAPGRSVSPVAGINEFPSGSTNVSLSGLPLASQYTILIDPQLGENGKIDWTKLEDIKVKLEYSYQDLFPAGQCQ